MPGDGFAKIIVALVPLRALVACRFSLQLPQLFGADPAKNIKRKKPRIDQRRTKIHLHSFGWLSGVVLPIPPKTDGCCHVRTAPKLVQSMIGRPFAPWANAYAVRGDLVGDIGTGSMARGDIALIGKPIIDLDHGIA